jgi:pyruvate kinase
LTARVTLGGEVSPGKGITLPGCEYRKESLSDKDRAIIASTQGLAAVRYAISYVRDALEMARYRELVGASACLIAKIERQPAVDEAVEIAAAADQLWLCRGDLGAELGLGGMAQAVQRFSEQVAGLQVPVLMAGQVLEHMASQPTPTRSEVCYLFDSLQRGYSGFVLSDETAVGRYPLESCQAAALFKYSAVPSGAERF